MWLCAIFEKNSRLFDPCKEVENKKSPSSKTNLPRKEVTKISPSESTTNPFKGGPTMQYGGSLDPEVDGEISGNLKNIVVDLEVTTN